MEAGDRATQVAADKGRAQGWSYASAALELGVLFAVLVIQLFFDWEGWSEYNSGELFVLHVLAAVLTLWTYRGFAAHSPSARHAVWTYRFAVFAVDVLVLVQAARALAHEASGSHKTQVGLLVPLVAVSASRLTWLRDAITDSAVGVGAGASGRRTVRDYPTL